ncbi:MAG TPA: iron export ABC transporter permease subunit FetB [Tetragenococcus sp.]|nr:iron export ABC transporter permease subunit FetB [Tetragenococcus sp.]
MDQVNISNLSLVFSVALVAIAIVISYKEKLGLSKEVIYAAIRAVVQLVVVGFVLKYVIGVNNFWLTTAMSLFIILNASMNGHKRNPSKNKKFYTTFFAIFISTYVTLSVLILAGALQLIPSQIIPITGMLANNAMVATGLCYRNLYNQFHDQRQQVWEKLALGAPIKLAAKSILQESIRVAIQPTIDSTKTVGLVSLPGTMSGLIFAGVDPVHAIKYQIMVMFMILATSSLAAILAGYSGYKEYFNKNDQLVN